MMGFGEYDNDGSGIGFSNVFDTDGWPTAEERIVWIATVSGNDKTKTIFNSTSH